MAGDWIKMRGNLWDDPRVARLCDITNQSEATIIGALYWLWASADQHTETGLMPGLTTRQMDRKTGVQGFADALIQVGWIAQHDIGIMIVNFTEHNGVSAKKRCQTAKRVANYKSGNAEVTQGALPSRDFGNAVSVSSALPREEKSKRRVREEEENPLTPLQGEDSQPGVQHPPKKRPKGVSREQVQSLSWPSDETMLAALRWFDYRQQRRQPLVMATWESMPKQAANDPDFVGKIDRSIANGYQGWNFPLEQVGNRGSPLADDRRPVTAKRLRFVVDGAQFITRKDAEQSCRNRKIDYSAIKEVVE